ncbi:hypothetical protein D3C84_411570 [compost metagenome]
MGDLAAEFNAGKSLFRARGHGLADSVCGLAGQACKHPPLLGNAELFKTWVATAHAAQDVFLQSLHQAGLSVVAQDEIGTGAQVFLKLPTCLRCRLQQWPLTHTEVPETQADQREQCHQRLREVAHQQEGQAVVIGVEHQRHVCVGGQVPKQPGVVVSIDGRSFPQVGVGDHDD